MTARELPETHAIEAILDATGTVRSRLIGDFICGKSAELRRAGLGLCRDYRLDVRRHLDDVVEMLKVECLRMIQEIIEQPTKLDVVTSWTGLLRNRARNEVSRYARSGASGEHLSGMDALLRRRNELAKTRVALLADLNREPTDQEIVQVTNERMHRTRKDAARQSMVCTMDDLAPVGFVPLLDDDHDLPYTDPTGDLLPHEGRELVDLIRAAVRDDKVLASVCDAWIGGVYDQAVGAPREINEVARITGLKVAQVAELLIELQVRAQEVALARFGPEVRPDVELQEASS